MKGRGLYRRTQISSAGVAPQLFLRAPHAAANDSANVRGHSHSRRRGRALSDAQDEVRHAVYPAHRCALARSDQPRRAVSVTGRHTGQGAAAGQRAAATSGAGRSGGEEAARRCGALSRAGGPQLRGQRGSEAAGACGGAAKASRGDRARVRLAREKVASAFAHGTGSPAGPRSLSSPHTLPWHPTA